MKLSLKQLKMVLSKLEYSMVGYSGTDKQDLAVEIELTKEDPGSGSMVDCLTIKATKPSTDDSHEGETRMEIEVYPMDQNLDPRASKIESFKVTKNY